MSMWKWEEIQKLLWKKCIICYINIVIMKLESDLMVDFDYISTELSNLNSKLKEIGDSL